MKLRIEGAFSKFGAKAIFFNDFVVVDKSVIEVIELIVVHHVVLFGLFRLIGFTIGCFLVFVFLIVFAFLCCRILMSSVLLDRRKVAFNFDTREHRLDQVLKAMAPDVVYFGKIFIIS